MSVFVEMRGAEFSSVFKLSRIISGIDYSLGGT